MRRVLKEMVMIMIFNDQLLMLRGYCEDHAVGGGVKSICPEIFPLLELRLCTVTGKEHTDISVFETDICTIIGDVRKFALSKVSNRVEEYKIGKSLDGVTAFLASICAEGNIPSGKIPALPYRRTIIGDEMQALIQRFDDVWDYSSQCAALWYPLEDVDIITKGCEALWLMTDYVKPYEPAIRLLIGLPDKPVYRWSNHRLSFTTMSDTARMPDFIWVDETSDPDFCNGYEDIYTDRDFSWAIYISHEETITFAGSIVPEIRRLMADISDSFNHYMPPDGMPLIHGETIS